MEAAYFVPILKPAVLDERGRCCGIKPLVYKRPSHRLYCHRCGAQFDPETQTQVENFSYRRNGDGFSPTYPAQDYWHGKSLLVHPGSKP